MNHGTYDTSLTEDETPSYMLAPAPHLARCYIGEVHNIERIRGRARATQRRVDAVLAEIIRTEHDDDSYYLAALARNLRSESAQLAHDRERVAAQKSRIRNIGTRLAAFDAEDYDLFWENAGDAPRYLLDWVVRPGSFDSKLSTGTPS